MVARRLAGAVSVRGVDAEPRLGSAYNLSFAAGSSTAARWIRMAANAPTDRVPIAVERELARLRRRIDLAMACDFRRLVRCWRDLKARAADIGSEAIAALAADIEVSTARRAARAASVPAISIDQSLPIAAHSDEIIKLLRTHPVVVLAGETGSGKTTQLPKLCLAAGRGTAGLIGCTQPRRLAARSVARRVAEELGTPLGGLVGWQVRFTEQVGENTLIKFMTDGILLAETETDRTLDRYDTLIIDEAHERSLNIDFLLGYLKRLLARRRDLRVVVTSATIDTKRFAEFFDGAPVVEVEGRSYPVEVRWRPPQPIAAGTSRRDAPANASARGRNRDVDPLVDVLDEITREDPRGDVLVFLPGEREIRDAHLALERRRYRETEVLPLYARLSANDQDRVFKPGVKRRIVLATNVAETSLTVPRIRHVVDPGSARVSRWSHRHKVQRLHIEAISQAAAEQRKGRCGRVGPGICWRLYDENDFARRARHTDPELKRSSLANVILRCLALRLGALEDFPFIDRPDERAVSDGYQQLLELGALAPDRRTLTGVGRTLAKLPIDVKLARMLVAAQALGSLRELLVLASFLSVQDPRERPADARELAEAAHQHWADPKSDFLAIVALWNEYCAAHEELTQSKLRDWCQAHYLSFLRMREWRELHRQLLLLTQELGWRQNEAPARYDAVHRALFAGLPTQIARRDEQRQYVGTRGRKYQLFPGSALAKKPPAWIISASVLDIDRVYALTNAEFDPAWVEMDVPHLVKKRHYDPHWSRAQGRVLGYESVSLFGLVVVNRRRVGYATIDPVEARAVFLREALLTGEIDCRAAFVRRNLAVLEAARREEAKRRRHGLLRPDDQLIGWLDARIPADINSAVGLDTWYRTLDGERRADLEWTLDDVLEAEAAPALAFPDMLMVGVHRLNVEYRFEPGHPADGATLVVPLKLLNALPEPALSWLVPGLLSERVTELIRLLPKPLRRHVVPAPDFARAFVAARGDLDVDPARTALTAALSAWIERTLGVDIPADAWQEAALPPHLAFNLRLIDARGTVLAESRDLAALRRDYGPLARAAFARQAAVTLARDGIDRWDFGDLPESVETDTGLAAWPALVDRGEAAAIRVYESREAAEHEHGAGVERLLRLALADKLRSQARQLPLSTKAAIAYTAVDSPEQLRRDIVESAFVALARLRCAGVRTAALFESLVADLRMRLGPACLAIIQAVEAILLEYAALMPRLKPPLLGFARANFDDLRAQLDGLVYPGFVLGTPASQLTELPRYLRAMGKRVERLLLDPRKDQQRMLEVGVFSDAWRRLDAACDPADSVRRAAIDRLRWLIEEYRVQLFAQELKTREPVSDKRLRKLFDQLGG